jgi:hypothetical protein
MMGEQANTLFATKGLIDDQQSAELLGKNYTPDTSVELPHNYKVLRSKFRTMRGLL